MYTQLSCCQTVTHERQIKLMHNVAACLVAFFTNNIVDWNQRGLLYLFRLNKSGDRINLCHLLNVSHFDRRLFRSIKVDLIEGKSQVSQSVCWSNLFLKIFSLAVDKRTKNNLYMHWVSAVSARFYHHLLFYRNLCFDRTDQWFRSNELSNELSIEWTVNVSRSKQPSIELTR